MTRPNCARLKCMGRTRSGVLQETTHEKVERGNGGDAAEHREDRRNSFPSDRAHGCPLAALGSELARSEKSTRSMATEGILKMIATVAERMKDPNTDRTKKSASVFVATMLGALTISRIVADPKVSNEILAAACAKLSSWE